MLYESLRKLIVEATSLNAEETFRALDLTFSVQMTAEDSDGQVELVEDGKNVAVCPSNVHDYVRLYAEQRMLGSNTKALQVILLLFFVFVIVACPAIKYSHLYREYKIKNFVKASLIAWLCEKRK